MDKYDTVWDQFGAVRKEKPKLPLIKKPEFSLAGSKKDLNDDLFSLKSQGKIVAYSQVPI